MSQKTELEIKFLKAAEDIKKIDKQLDNDELLTLYSYYKQSIEGDCNIAEPGMFDLRGKAKYSAWKELTGISKEKAMKYYIKKVNNLLKK